MLGISGLVVPRARIPVSYNAKDDYGLSRLEFATSWKTESAQENEQQDRVLPIAKFSTDPAKIVRQAQDVGVLELEPLKLPIGTSLKLLVRGNRYIARKSQRLRLFRISVADRFGRRIACRPAAAGNRATKGLSASLRFPAKCDGRITGTRRGRTP